jgi:hypothetical protein
MLSLLSSLILAQTTPSTAPTEIVRPQAVRALPGQLDSTPVFNSNSPELVQTEGILLSTFPPDNKRSPDAHLSFPLTGRFDIFAHHVAKPPSPDNLRSLYQGILLHNPNSNPVTVDILQGSSYLSQPDAPFVELRDRVYNPDGEVYAGPGDRVANEVLRGWRQSQFPARLVLAPGESQMLMNLPIPVRPFDPPLNGRSTLLRVRSDGEVYVASLAQYATTDAEGNETAPTLAQWQALLENGELAGPRDRPPTPPNQSTGQIIYGRVAGVSQGSQWQTTLRDRDGVETRNFNLTVPSPEQVISYGIATLPGGTWGTDQIQSAPMLVRYPDTAYRAHGNYGVQYSIDIPLYNKTDETRVVQLRFETPIKEDNLSQDGLRFFQPPPDRIFFRGTLRFRYADERDRIQTRYWHLVQRRGQSSSPLVTLQLAAGERRLVEVDLIYPADSTPPQVLTIETLAEEMDASSQ